MPGETQTSIHQAQLSAIDKLIEYHSTSDNFTEAIRLKSLYMLIDTISCIFDGRGSNEVKAFEESLGAYEKGIFHFPGGPCLSPWSCASVSAMASTWSEACEGLPYAHGRPGLPIVGALLAMAAQNNTKLIDVLKSLVLGYEVGARCGGWLRIRPGMHVDGNWPGLGVAVAVAGLLGLTNEQKINALNIAACQLPTSLYLPIKTGNNARNTYLSHSAILGLMSAFSAKAGITAPRNALIEYAQNHALNDGLPVPNYKYSFIEDSYFKPFASARHVHYGVEAALKIMEKLTGSIDDIHSIVLSIYPEAATYAGNRDPQAMITGQFSLSLGVASAIRFGHMDPELYDPKLFFDRDLRKIEKMVQIEINHSLEKTGVREAELIVKTKNGCYAEKIESLMGDPKFPLSQNEMIEKFVKYSKTSVKKVSAQKFINTLLNDRGELRFADAWQTLF